jgi:hypothetical protein
VSLKSPNSEILVSEVVETRPRNLDVSLEIDKERVKIMPVLLNQGDSITLKVLVNAPSELHFGKNIAVEGRIVGVRNIKKTDPTLKSYFIFTFPRLLLLSGTFFLFVFGIPIVASIEYDTPVLVSFFFFASVLSATVSSWVWWSITKEAQRIRGMRDVGD